MESDPQSLFGLLCTAILIGGDPATPLLAHLVSYTRALLVSQDPLVLGQQIILTHLHDVISWVVVAGTLQTHGAQERYQARSCSPKIYYIGNN
jgi:hypothetical protein